MRRTLTTAVVAIALLLTGCGASAPQAGSSASAASSTSSASAASPKATTLSNYEVQQAFDKLWASRNPSANCTGSAQQRAIDELAPLLEEATGSTSALTYTTTYVTAKCEDWATAAQAKAQAAADAKAEKALTNPKSYAEISKRQLAKVVRNPDAYVGKKYVIYGEVTQYDSATGEDAMLADVAYKNTARGNYGYFEGENSMITKGKATNMGDVVEDDIVKMYVTVVGSFSYDTQIGGNTTVPQFTVNILKRVS